MDDVRIDRRGFLMKAGAMAAGVGVLPPGLRAVAEAGPRLTVGPIRRVGADGSKYFEPWIAAHPRDASKLVIVGSLDLSRGPDPEHFHMEPAAWSSPDGGISWAPVGVPFPTAVRPRERAVFADNQATYAPDGTAFWACLGGAGDRWHDVWIYRSDDGRRWQGPTRVPGFLDYPRIVADQHNGKPRLFLMANGPGDGPVFGDAKRPGYGCVVLRSDDGGRTISAANLLAPSTLLHTPIESPSILPDGRLLVGFVDFPDMPVPKKPQAQVSRGRIYTASSRDGGATFSLPAPIRDVPLIEGYGDGFVVIAVDRSDGPRRGRIYALTYTRSDEGPVLQLQTSENAVDWTPPAAVPGLRRGATPFAAIAVSPRGVLGLLWIQGNPGEAVRNLDPEWCRREHAWELFFTASADGGATFAAPVPLLRTPSRTDPNFPNWPYHGDYISIAAAADGAFHPLWIDSRDGKGEMQTTRIEVRT